jgi:hypothetical protein
MWTGRLSGEVHNNAKKKGSYKRKGKMKNKIIRKIRLNTGNRETGNESSR